MRAELHLLQSHSSASPGDVSLSPSRGLLCRLQPLCASPFKPRVDVLVLILTVKTGVKFCPLVEGVSGRDSQGQRELLVSPAWFCFLYLPVGYTTVFGL